MKKTLTLLIVLILNTPLFAQQASCYIEIIAEPNIRVSLNNKFIGSTSIEENGLFIQDIPKGSHTLKFEKKKFKTQIYTVQLQSEQVLNFKLKPFMPKIEIIETGNSAIKEEIYEIGNIKIQSLPTSINISIPDLEINRLKKQNNLSFNNVPVGEYNITYTWRQKVLNSTIVVNKDATTHIMVNLLKGDIKDLSTKSSQVTNIVKTLSSAAPGMHTDQQATEKKIDSIDSIEMIRVEAGSFKMGCDNKEVNEIPVHDVSVNGFFIAKYEVNQKLWKSIMGNNPSYFKNDSLPVEQVSWLDTQIFIKKLNEKTGKRYRLPTEAEWEYAARGGKLSKSYNFAGSNNIGEVAWVDYNSNKKTQKTGQKKANELGIYDMSGNILEWCNDWYSNYTIEAKNNPIGMKTGVVKSTRGGSWFRGSEFSHIAKRSFSDPSYGKINLGFRLAQDM